MKEQIKKAVEKVKHPSKSLEGSRTYLMGFAIAAHQILKTFGIDIPDEQFSVIIDGVLAVGAIYYRWKAKGGQ